MTALDEVVAMTAAVADAELRLRSARARLVAAMRQAHDDDGATTTDLVTATGKARSWVHTQLHYDRRQG